MFVQLFYHSHRKSNQDSSFSTPPLSLHGSSSMLISWEARGQPCHSLDTIYFIFLRQGLSVLKFSKRLSCLAIEAQRSGSIYLCVPTTAGILPSFLLSFFPPSLPSFLLFFIHFLFIYCVGHEDPTLPGYWEVSSCREHLVWVQMIRRAAPALYKLILCARPPPLSFHNHL